MIIIEKIVIEKKYKKVYQKNIIHQQSDEYKQEHINKHLT